MRMLLKPLRARAQRPCQKLGVAAVLSPRPLAYSGTSQAEGRGHAVSRVGAQKYLDQVCARASCWSCSSCSTKRVSISTLAALTSPLYNWSAHTDAQHQEAASPQVLRSGGLRR